MSQDQKQLRARLSALQDKLDRLSVSPRMTMQTASPPPRPALIW